MIVDQLVVFPYSLSLILSHGLRGNNKQLLIPQLNLSTKLLMMMLHKFLGFKFYCLKLECCFLLLPFDVIMLVPCISLQILIITWELSMSKLILFCIWESCKKRSACFISTKDHIANIMINHDTFYLLCNFSWLWNSCPSYQPSTWGAIYIR